VPLANPEPGAKLETLCTEHVLYVCLVKDQGTPRRPVVLACACPTGGSGHEHGENSPHFLANKQWLNQGEENENTLAK